MNECCGYNGCPHLIVNILHRIGSTKNPHSEEQGRHCTYNKTVRRVRVTLLLWKTKTFTDSSNIRFHENVPSGSPVVPRGRTDGQTDMTTRLIVAFRNFTNRPEITHADRRLRCPWSNRSDIAISCACSCR
jgi:hypothetical protein